jgi:NhaP-type Na+/H+ or K+/H+ antiporter
LRGGIPDDILLTVGVAVAVVLYAQGLNLGKREIKTEKPEIYRRKRRKR